MKMFKKIKYFKAPLGSDMSFSSMEAFNSIRTALYFSLPDVDGTQFIGITSSLSGDGKSYSAVNLAYALAKDNKKVLLIDGDLRRPSISSRLNLNTNYGYSEVIAGLKSFGNEDTLNKAVLHENLDVLASGTIPPNPSELLGSKKSLDFINYLKGKYDYVIIDLPPIGLVTDAIVLGKMLNGLVVVVRHNYTSNKNLKESQKLIHAAGINLLGYLYNANSTSAKTYGYY